MPGGKGSAKLRKEVQDCIAAAQARMKGEQPLQPQANGHAQKGRCPAALPKGFFFCISCIISTFSSIPRVRHTFAAMKAVCRCNAGDLMGCQASNCIGKDTKLLLSSISL